jgi:putative aldouronate transport system permease protein
LLAKTKVREMSIISALVTNKGNELLVRKKPGNFRKIINSLNRNKEFCLMVLPFMILIVIFCYVPFYGITIAFKDFHYDLGILKSPWLGFENFRFLLTSGDLFLILRNTVGFNLMFIAVGTAVNLAVALMLFEIKNKLFVKTYQTLMFAPYFLSWVVVSFILMSLLSPDLGVINKFISHFGIAPVDWYSNPALWPFILLAAFVWKGVGYGSIIYYAVLIGIDKEYFEAATIDGASKMQMVFKISLPFLRTIIIIMLLFAIGGIIRSDFGLFYFLPKDNPLLFETTQTIDTYVYRALKNSGEFGIPAAVNLVQSIVGFLLIILSNAFVRKVDKDSALF